MKKITVKIPAKINLTLDVLGVSGKYHDIKSLIASINVFDAITISERKDNRITLTCKGRPIGCNIADNNAYKTAKLFKENYSVKGVDITIQKNIPVGGGLGGSSADVAGVLLGMKALFNVNAKLEPLANELGSDCLFMLSGGYGVMSGRGDVVEKKSFDKVFPLLLITEKGMISARNAYKRYDEEGKSFLPSTDTAVRALEEGKEEEFYNALDNHLESSAKALMPDLEFNLGALKKAGAKVAHTTGSGPTVFGIFSSTRERNLAYNKLKPLFGDALIKAETLVNPVMISGK